MASLMTEAKKLAQKSGTFRKGPRSLKFFLAGGDGDSYKVFQNSAFPTLKLDYSFFDFLRSLFNFYF